VAVTSEEEKRNCCVDGPLIAELIISWSGALEKLIAALPLKNFPKIYGTLWYSK
jgi:hypothetical protein